MIGLLSEQCSPTAPSPTTTHLMACILTLPPLNLASVTFSISSTSLILKIDQKTPASGFLPTKLVSLVSHHKIISSHTLRRPTYIHFSLHSFVTFV